MAARLDELNRFLRDALERGIPRPEIERALLEAGWHPEQVKKALATFAEVAFPLPVPRPVPHVSAGEAFLYLVLFTALGASVFSVVELFFTLIEFVFYDPASTIPINRDAWVPGVRWSVARAVIAFPVFLFASYWVARGLKRDPAERTSPIRRWLTYVAMFLAVTVIIGDFVTLVAYVLSGETTARFLLKVAVVAVVAGVILGYYLWDLRESESARRPAVAAALIVVAILAWGAAVGSGVWMMGPPSEQAARRIDDRRLQDLRSLARGVDLYFERNAALPESLSALTAALETTLSTNDPESGAPYDYRPGDGKRFELCADFARASEDVLRDAVWTHGVGPQCFTLTAGDKERR